MALRKGRQDLPTPHRGRMGIRLPCRNAHVILLRHSTATTRDAQSMGPAQYALGRRGVGPRLARPLSARSADRPRDRKSTRLNSSHVEISYAVFCLKKKKKKKERIKKRKKKKKE